MSRKLVGISVEANSKASRCLDFLRFFAALTVLLQHMAPVFGVGGPPQETGNVVVDLLKHGLYEWSLSGFKFVMLFFVLSGFLVSSSVLRTIENNSWSWRVYLTNRLTRLWIVLIPALLITAAGKFLEYQFFGLGDGTPSDERWTTFLGNMFFLQGIDGFPIFGHNGPLWSLSYEFWYYILFPCIVLAIKSPKRITKLLYAAVTLIIMWFLGSSIVSLFLVWLLGSLLVFMRAIRFKSLIIGASLLVLSITLNIVMINSNVFNYFLELGARAPFNYVLAGANLQIPGLLPDMMVGISFSITIYLIMCLFNQKPTKVSRWYLSSTLAGFSYTLYLVHYPVLDFFYQLKISKWWHLPQPDFYNWFAVVSVIFMIFAWLISILTEAKTNKVRKFVIGMLNTKRLSDKKTLEG